MKSQKLQTEHINLPGDEEFSLPDFSIPVNNGGDSCFDRNASQYVLANCYGKGKRLCDFKVPDVETSSLKSSLSHLIVTSSTDSGKDEKDNPAVNQPDVKDLLLKRNTQSSAQINNFQWTVLPPNVCQIDGVPLDLDQEILDDIVSFYSTIVAKQDQKNTNLTSIRYKLGSPEVCETLAFAIDGTDMFGTGQEITCKHLTS